MRLTEQEIKKYQKLYLKKYGKEISLKESSRQLERLVLFIKAVVSDNPIK